jgi:hypothetical protein
MGDGTLKLKEDETESKRFLMGLVVVVERIEIENLVLMMGIKKLERSSFAFDQHPYRFSTLESEKQEK